MLCVSLINWISNINIIVSIIGFWLIKDYMDLRTDVNYISESSSMYSHFSPGF